MGIVSRIGQWLDIRFPEKISADAVLSVLATMNAKITALELTVEAHTKLYDRIAELEKKSAEQVSEMNKAKMAFMSLRPQPSTFPHR